MTFAIIETGGKQYKVFKDAIIDIEKLSKADPKLKEGSKVVFDKILLLDDGKNTKIGDPYIEGAKVEATFIHEKKGKKVKGLRFKNKVGASTTPYGHRQVKTRLKIAKV